MLSGFTEFIITTFQNGTDLFKFLSTAFVSMIPVIELRGGIPVGVAMDLNYWLVFLAAVIGNMLPIPFILLFLEKIFAFMKKHIPKLGALVDKLEKRANAKGDAVRKYKKLGLFILVAIPLPGTGAWTGALVASVLEMDFKESLLMIFLGVLAAGVLVSGITSGFMALFM